MVTQHGVPKTGRSNSSVSSNNNTSTVNTRPANSRPGFSHSRAISDSPSLLSSPPNTRRNSLPGNTSFPDDDHDHEAEHLDSHITFLDSLDLDSTSTIDSTIDSEDPSPRVRRLCQTPGAKCSHSMPRRHTGSERRGLDFGLPKSIDDATSIMGKNQDREVIEQRRDYQHQRRVGSAQSGRSIDSRPSTSNSIREEDEENSEDERVRKKNGKLVRQSSISGGMPESSTTSRSEQQQEGSRKGPIKGLTTSPGRRRHRSSVSTDTLNFDKKDEGEETGEQTGTMSAWRKRRIAENAAAAFRNSVARSSSAGDYSKEEQEADRKAEKAALEEISKGKERMNGIGSETTAAANGSPIRVASRRNVSSNGASTLRSTMNGNGNGNGNGVDKGKGSIIPLRESLGSQVSTGSSKTRKAGEKHETAAAGTEAGRAAIAREEAAKRVRSPTITASSSDKQQQQRASPTLGGGKERPSSSASLRSGLPRPSNSGPNTPIKAKASLSSPAPPSRSKTGLPSPSPRHERTKSAAPSMLQRSSTFAPTSSTTATVTASTTSSRSQSSNSSATTARDSTIRSREPPKLRNFTAPVQPSPIQEASKEDISRVPGSPTPVEMAKTSSSSGPSSSHSHSRSSSSHSAIYSPTTTTADKDLNEEHHQIVDHLETLRKIARASPQGSNRSSWSTEAEEAADKPKSRERRREERKKGGEEEDAEREVAQVKELIASIDSLGKGQGIGSPRLSRTKSLDSVLPQRSNSSFAEPEKQETPPRPRSAGRDSHGTDLVTPIKLFSPDSEMGEFTARLLRSPAVEDYEDLLNMEDSDKEGEDSMRQQQQRVPISPPMSPVEPSSPLAEKHTATLEDLANIPKPPREIIKVVNPRRAIIKTAVIKKTVHSRSATRIPKRSILEDDSDVDSLDHLIQNDQDFSALLKPGSSDDEDVDSIEILVGSKQYDPGEAKTQPVRSRTDVATADRQAEAERAVHEKLMNRLKTLQLEVRSATRGIEVLEQWLQSGGDSSSGSSDIISDISEQEGILYRLRCEEERQRARLEWRILEEAKKKHAKGSWTMWVLKWGCVVFLAMAIWMALEVAIFISQMPPEFSNVPYELKEPPTVGTRPTRAIISGVITATQLPIWLAQKAWWTLQPLWAGIQVALVYLCQVVSALSSRASSIIVSTANGAASGAASAIEGVVGKLWQTIEGLSAAAPVVEVVQEIVRHPAEVVVDAADMGGEQVIWGGEVVW